MHVPVLELVEPVKALEPDELAAAEGAAAEATGAATTGAATDGETAGAAEAFPAAEGAAWVSGVAAEAEAAGEEAGEAALGEAPDAPDDVPDDPAAPHLGPVGGAKLGEGDAVSTDDPGSGNLVSWLEGVVQSVVGIFAMNISGKEAAARSDSSGMLYSSISLSEVSRLFEPAVILTFAQFMYISRLPILLNHVQARVYVPAAIPCGME